jgi:hypothetical protein
MNSREKLHNELCDKVDELTNSYNPCSIKNVDGILTCTDGELCCAPCKYLSDNGCTIKSLGCKLYFCYTVQKKYPELMYELSKIKNTAKEYRLIKMREPF